MWALCYNSPRKLIQTGHMQSCGPCRREHEAVTEGGDMDCLPCCLSYPTNSSDLSFCGFLQEAGPCAQEHPEPSVTPTHWLSTLPHCKVQDESISTLITSCLLLTLVTSTCPANSGCSISTRMTVGCAVTLLLLPPLQC